jgi:hypothetical protein
MHLFYGIYAIRTNILIDNILEKKERIVTEPKSIRFEEVISLHLLLFYLYRFFLTTELGCFYVLDTCLHLVKSCRTLKVEILFLRHLYKW